MSNYLYQGKIYNCSEVTTEAELYGADCFYGYGKALLFLDELEGGNYVNADDCVQVTANSKEVSVLSCANCQHYSAQSWGDGWNEPRETQESCTKSQWEFEEPSPSPVTSCELFEFAIADEYVEEIIDIDFDEF